MVHTIPQTKPVILIVDDDPAIRESLQDILVPQGYRCLEARDGVEALEIVRQKPINLMLLDLLMPRMNGLEVLKESIKLRPGMSVIIISAHGTIDKAVQAIKYGAYDFLEKPLEMERTLITVRNALERGLLKQERDRFLSEAKHRYRMIGSDPQMLRIFDLIDRAAKVDSKVLITGEPGTGKELVARAIHLNSRRAAHPFVPVNCSAIPETLVESELFGHTKGAFTGAVAERIGRFQRANRGTLFLDEIGDMSLMMQAKVLRVIEDNIIEPVGADKPLSVDVRIIAATNRNLDEAVEKGDFRNDLFYRLNVIHIYLPPLRERREDIRPLAETFLNEVCLTQGLPQKTFAKNVWSLLQDYDWPGNVRELRNVVERVAVLSPDVVIDTALVQESLSSEPVQKDTIEINQTLREARAKFEREYIIKILAAHGGKISEAAKALGIERSHLYKKMRQYNIDEGSF